MAIMKYRLDGKTLLLSWEGEITSGNAESLREETLSVLDQIPFSRVLLDFSNVSYISSAGLRVVLGLKKQVGDLAVVEAPLEVYSIFDMTGFTKILPVYKKLPVIDVAGKQVIGEGRTGIVYRLNKDTIVKVYKRLESIEYIEREMALSREAFVLGIPTAITFDVVRVGDHLASRFEMLDCFTLSEAFASYPEHEEELLDAYAKMLLDLNHASTDKLELPSKKQDYLEHTRFCKEHLTPNDYLKLVSLIHSIPEAETFIHGDCHMKNVMCDGKNLYLIDLGSMAKGYPIFELAALYRTFRCFDYVDPGNCSAFLELPQDALDRIFDGLLRRYFDNNLSQDILDKIAILALVYMISWSARHEKDPEMARRRNQDAAQRLSALLSKVDDLLLPIG